MLVGWFRNTMHFILNITFTASNHTIEFIRLKALQMFIGFQWSGFMLGIDCFIIFNWNDVKLCL